MEAVSAPFTNAQLEILKLFSRPMSDVELVELKTFLGKYYAKKATEEADRLWEERGYTQKTMDEWINEPT